MPTVRFIGAITFEKAYTEEVALWIMFSSEEIGNMQCCSSPPCKVSSYGLVVVSRSVHTSIIKCYRWCLCR